MHGTVLERSLNAVATRLYKLRVLRRQALCWILLLVPAIALVLWLPQVPGFVSTNLVVLLGITIVGLAVARWKVPAPTTIETAQLIEKNRPELNDAVLTAVRVDAASRGQLQSSVMNQWVIDEADQLARSSDWKSVVPSRQMLMWSTLSLLAFCFLITGVVAAGRWGREIIVPTTPVSLSELGEAAVIGDTELIVEPGDVEIERGSALTVVARFGRVLPTDVLLQLTSEAKAATFTMEPTVDEGVFAARVNAVDGDATYRVFFGHSVTELASIDRPDFEQKSDSYKVLTYVRPRLEQVDALITPPAYTKKEQQLVEDTLRVTAVEGSTVRLTLHLNKPVAIAELRAEGDSVIPLTSIDAESGRVMAEIEAVENRKFRVYLEDDAGRTAAEEQTISLKVTHNARPKIKVTFPGRDTNVSPLQEFYIEAEATDDFGFTDFGVMYSVTNGTPAEISLFEPPTDVPPAADAAVVSDSTSPPSTTSTKLKLQHMIEMEQLQVGPDELLSYYFYVEDIASDGEPRRTYSDMMFAEVRRYEEIFREGEQQDQQPKEEEEQEESSPTEELLELQRQIMIATWNTQRTLDANRSRQKLLDKAAADATVVLESQQQAIQQLQEVKEAAADDPDSMKIVDGIERDMNKAVESLASFTAEQHGDRLQAALFAEQSAFAGLMRLRAKEHQVSKSQSQGKGKGQNSASQQQLDQLELDNERNRYESEKQAQEQQAQNAEQKQDLQILNRLKELARRQEMVNERLKQLESELRTAQTEEQKQEIERELKRLREEQREMLRDVDELRETMDQQSAEQQQKNQETREQVEDARERVQQASEAMDEGKLSEAIAEGTRAERQFEQLQEDFRNQTSNQFSEAMRDLRDQAHDISERQDEIARELAGESQAAEDGEPASTRQKPSLRNDRDREGLQEKVAQQRDDLERVLGQAKQLVEEAEDSEPLMSRRLYDTIRETREKRPDEALEATEILVSRGLWNKGQQAEKIAREGIEDLAQGIEKAADAVLGSQAESLRRAQDEIEDLANQLSGEIAEATGEHPNAPTADTSAAAEGQAAMPRDGQPSSEASSQQQGTQRVAAPRPQTEQSANGENQPSQDAQPGTGQTSQRTPSGSSPGESSPNTEEKPRQQPAAANVAGEQGQGQPSQPQEGEPQQGEGEGQQPGAGQQPGEGQQPGQGQQGGNGRPRNSLMNGGREGQGGSAANQGRPLTGDEFRDWSNRLREVEEILDDPELRNQVAQVRDRARAIRAEFRRHGTEPKWDLVKSQLLDEMTSLQKRIKQELSKITSDRSMVPIDREPVPAEFDELVRRYYELLGQSRKESK